MVIPLPIQLLKRFQTLTGYWILKVVDHTWGMPQYILRVIEQDFHHVA